MDAANDPTAAVIEPNRLRQIWVLTDGRAGNDAQALGLAQAVARRTPAAITHHRVRLRSWAAPVPATVAYNIGRVLPGWHRWVLAEGQAALAPPWPRPALAIGAGRRVAPMMAWLGRRYGIRTVQLLDPQMAADAFSTLVVPQHDELAQQANTHVLPSLGALNRITPDGVAAAAIPWRSRLAALREPRLAVMLGGSSRSASFSDADQARLAIALDSLAERFGLIISPSRRTPEALVDRLRQTLNGRAYLWDGSGDNPYPGLLDLAMAVLVTEDSVNMASEAATAGLPVLVYRLSRVAPKLRRFHEDLQRYGAARPFTGDIAPWEYPPLAEADRIAQALLRREML